MKTFLILLIGLSVFTGCKDSSDQNENALLLAEFGKQQAELLKQVRENGEAVKRLEKENLRMQKLLERQQALIERRMRRNSSRIPRSRLGRMIEAMSRKNSPSEIAEILNRKNTPHPDGSASWTEEHVQKFLKKSRPSKPKDK